jgi:hypothetical protein
MSVEMRLSQQLQHLMGKHWVLRSRAPIELSPSGDIPPFAREVISITRIPGTGDLNSLYESIATTMGPMLWAGSLAYREHGDYDECATIDVLDNPLSGPVLLVAKLYHRVQETILLMYERHGEANDREAIVNAIGRLTMPLLQQEHPELIAQGTPVEEKYPVPRLLETLQGTPLYSALQAAFAETDPAQQHLRLGLIMADIADEPRLVQELGTEAFADLVRAAEAVNAVFLRLDIAPAIMWSASVLARVLLFHPDADDKCIGRSLQLSRLLIDKVRGISAGRMEEAILTNLVARAKRVTKQAGEDYGDLGELVRELKGGHGTVYRILLRLIMNHPCFRGKDHLSPAERVARCDLAIALMQEMQMKGVELVPEQHAESHLIDLDAEYASLPAEFRLLPEPVEVPKNFQLYNVIVAIEQIVFRNMENIYGVDLMRMKAEVRKYLEDHWGSKVAPEASLLFLRGFRSSKRIWMENSFKFDRKVVIPYMQEPPRLSIEAALNKGLSMHFGPIAIGGVPDPLGMGRLFTPLQRIDFWKTVFETVSTFASIILVLPDSSDALTWEIGQLIDRGCLGRIVLLMVPAGLDTKASASWEQVQAVFRNKGLGLCHYRSCGGFILLSDEGEVREEFEFSSLMDGVLGERLHELFPT